MNLSNIDRQYKSPRPRSSGRRLWQTALPAVPRSGITSAAGLLTYGSSPFGAFPSDGISTLGEKLDRDSDWLAPCRRTPQLQWRARAGVSPAFLFFPTESLPLGGDQIGTPHAILFPFARLGDEWPKINAPNCRKPQRQLLNVRSRTDSGGPLCKLGGSTVRAHGSIKLAGKKIAGDTIAGNAEELLGRGPIYFLADRSPSRMSSTTFSISGR